MKDNYTMLEDCLTYIEEHLSEAISLDDISAAVGYSKYHFLRLFTAQVGITVHEYILRRQLTEGARRLTRTDEGILNISIACGFETQQSFSKAFKKYYKKPPGVYRSLKEFYPLQLRFNIGQAMETVVDERIMGIRPVEATGIYLVGFKGNTKKGFGIIGKLWRRLQKKKHLIINRIDEDWLIGLDDYTFSEEISGKNPAFEYFAGSAVSCYDNQNTIFSKKELPRSRYLVFTYKGYPEDSIEAIIDYIYRLWFPASTAILNDEAKYDFIKYGELLDEKGMGEIEVWVPIY